MNIGVKEGKLVVFGGVYSNLQALEALHAEVSALGIEPSNVFCTGDIVAYCADPSACLSFIEEWGIHSIKGNVEFSLLDQNDSCGCNFNEGSRCDIFSKQWYPFAQAQVGNKHDEFLKAMPEKLSFSYGAKEVAVVHGSDRAVSEYIFKSSPWSIKQSSFAELDADVILSGHSGIPFQDMHDGKYWLNAGVIGMPANDGGTHTWYMLLDLDAAGELLVSFHKLNYNHKKASQQMIDHALPSSYAQTLLTGIWDNTEILPEVETGQEGMELNFDADLIRN